MIKLDKYKTSKNYETKKLASFVAEVLDSKYGIRLQHLLIYDAAFGYKINGDLLVENFDGWWDKSFDEKVQGIIEKIVKKHYKTVDVTQLKKIAKLQIIKYKRK